MRPISTRTLIPTLALLLCASAAHAQSMSPGLWSMQNKMGGNPELEKAMAEMQKQMASMPPEQRKQMEAMMGKGRLDVGPGGAMTVKVCVTPEMASRLEMPRQSQGDCTTTVTSRSGNQMKMSYVCKTPPSSGEGIYTFSGDKAYTMKMVINSVQQGKPQSMTMEGQGQWLAADCGAVKPIEMPAAKK